MKIIKKQGQSEKLSQPKKKAQGDLITKCNVISWMGFWKRKRKLGKN